MILDAHEMELLMTAMRSLYEEPSGAAPWYAWNFRGNMDLSLKDDYRMQYVIRKLDSHNPWDRLSAAVRGMLYTQEDIEP